MDGIRNHLWVALKTAIQQWFNDKVEQVLGLGKAVWNLLTKGGIQLAQIGKMAWEAIKAAIPPALIALLIERLVAMLVPAAAAVMAIIQGLQAAWGAVQRILAAIDRFVAFLKAVRGGGAGPAFAQALAAAAVAVIEFVSQFLLRKIAGAAKKVAGKIKAIAQRIGQRIMGAVKKVGAKVKRGAGKLRDKVFGKKTPAQKQAAAEKKRKAQEERIKKAEQAIRKALNKGVRGRMLKVWMAGIKLAYRLSSITVNFSGNAATVTASINPKIDVPAHKVIVDQDQTDDGDDKGQAAGALTSYFRTVSVAEYEKIVAGQELNLRTKESREGGRARGLRRVLRHDQRRLLAPDRRSADGGRRQAGGGGQVRDPAPDRNRGRRRGRAVEGPRKPAAPRSRWARGSDPRSGGPAVPGEGRAGRRRRQARASQGHRRVQRQLRDPVQDTDGPE